jgi:hypothetical protein
MTGKAYYLTTLGAWRRHAGRLANSHWLALNSDASDGFTEDASAAAVAAGTACRAPTDDASFVLDENTRILALIEADEGAHLALQDDVEFEQLPHPLGQRPISDGAYAALAAHGVSSGANTFDAAEVVARVHPLLRHRVF